MRMSVIFRWKTCCKEIGNDYWNYLKMLNLRGQNVFLTWHLTFARRSTLQQETLGQRKARLWPKIPQNCNFGEHSPMEAKNAIIATPLPSWHAVAEPFMMQTSFSFSAWNCHPLLEMHPKAITEKSWKRKRNHLLFRYFSFFMCSLKVLKVIKKLSL